MLFIHTIFVLGVVIGLFTIYAPKIHICNRKQMLRYERELKKTDPEKYKKLKEKYKR